MPSDFNATLNADASRAKFEEMRRLHPDVCGSMTIEQLAYGFVLVANEAMSRPIRNLTQSRGFDVSQHTLACFGGAGGQHCCAIAASLGMRRIFIHRYSGILSAYGMSLANVVHEAQEPISRNLLVNGALDPYFSQRLSELAKGVVQHLRKQGFDSKSIVAEEYLNLRYAGTDQAVMTLNNADGFEHSFVSSYQREYGFILDRPIIVDDIRVRGIANCVSRDRARIAKCDPHSTAPEADEFVICSFESGVDQDGRRQVGEQQTPLYSLEKLLAGHVINGPAIIIDKTSTIVVDPNCIATISDFGDVEIIIQRSAERQYSSSVCDPVLLSIFSHRFMGIAEQMGRTLQRTAISTNIKERLGTYCVALSCFYAHVNFCGQTSLVPYSGPMEV